MSKIEEQLFGSLSPDAKRGGVVGAVSWHGRELRVWLGSLDAESAGGLEGVSSLLTSLADLRTVAKSLATSELLDVKNRDWLEGEEPLTPEQFRDRMLLVEVQVPAEGGCILHFDDGDLFWGHPVEVGFDGDREPSWARFEGQEVEAVAS